MKVSFLAVGLLLAGISTGPIASAAEGYDNPTKGIAPCVVLNRYQADRKGKDAPVFSASAEIENICGRTLVVSICFLLAEPVSGSDRQCTDELLRPWSDAAVNSPGAPVRITGPDYRWHYLPVR